MGPSNALPVIMIIQVVMHCLNFVLVNKLQAISYWLHGGKTASFKEW